MKKKSINGEMYDIISEEEFFRNPELYKGYKVAVENDGLLYPIRAGVQLKETGFYPRNQFLARYVEPPERFVDKYKSEDLIDFDNAKDIHELIEQNNVYKDMEREILTSPDNLYVPKHSPTESPESEIIKDAVVSKEIDINKYKERWGDSFNNDKKEISKDRLSLPKLVRICNNLDIKATLTLENNGPDVPNPMKKPLSIVLTGRGVEE